MDALGRGQSGGVWGRRQPEVGEDGAHDTGVLHGGDERKTEGNFLPVKNLRSKDGTGTLRRVNLIRAMIGEGSTMPDSSGCAASEAVPL